MDYGIDMTPIVADTSPAVATACESIISANLAPDVKIARLSTLLQNAGLTFYSQTYSDASDIFANTIKSSSTSDDSAPARLAQKMMQDYALSRDNVAADVESYFHLLLGQAQNEAFQNAKSMQKHPTLTRSIVGETCDWCESKAGVYTDPTGDDFARHRDCDCLFSVSGYNSRNGIVENYVKK